MDIGPQYKLDDPFKAAARLHQSNYRARVLNVDYAEYGNRLTEIDGRKLLNYYDGLGVQEVLRKRYPAYSEDARCRFAQERAHSIQHVGAPLGQT